MALSTNPLRDAVTEKSIALPAGASAVSSASIDTKNTEDGDMPCVNLEIVAPAVTVAMLADTETIIYKVEESADDSSFATVDGMEAVITQTGAGGAGAVTDTVVVRVPQKLLRYTRLTATKSVSGDASGVSANFAITY